MTITCTTLLAAAKVVAVLTTAQLRIGLDYRVEPPEPFEPPTTFTILVDLPASILDQLRAIPDTTIN